MADKTIDDFNAVVTPATTDVLIISQANVAKKETVAQLDTLLSATTKTLTNKTLTSPVINTAISGTAIDTDGTLAANSDTKVASQKAVKTYADTKQTLATALTALAALTPAAHTVPLFSSASSATSVVINEQTLLGRITGGLIAALTASQVRTLLELVVGTNVLAYDASYDDKTGKAWCKWLPDGSIPASASYNITSITDNGAGDWTINIGTDFSSANWAYSLNCESVQAAGTLAENIQVVNGGQAAGTLRVTCINTSAINTEIDAAAMSFMGFGDQ